VLVTHAKSLTVVDATGTATIWNGATTSSIAATDVMRPSDWNSGHLLSFQLTGNTTNAATFTGTQLIFAGSGGLSVGVSASSLIISGAQPGTLSTYVPYWPASTTSQVLGSMGTSTASALVFPVIIDDAVIFNAVRLLYSASFVSSTVSGQQTISSNFGIFSNNAGTLSRISSGSFSLALTVSSVSATLSLPTSTNSAGYTYGTVSASTTANAHSLFGTAGNRVADMVFGGNMTLTPGLYWIGLHQRQSSSSANVGMSTAMVGNAMNGTSGNGPLGSSTAAFSNSAAYHMGAHGFYTSTGSAGYSGTNLPSSLILTAFNNNVNVMPMVTFMSS
jgi:hypothetical protein